MGLDGVLAPLSLAIVACILSFSEGQSGQTLSMQSQSISINSSSVANNTSLNVTFKLCNRSASVFVLEAFVVVRNGNTTNSSDICRNDVTDIVGENCSERQNCTINTKELILSLTNDSCPVDVGRFRINVTISYVCIPDNTTTIEVCSNDTQSLYNSTILVGRRTLSDIPVDTPFTCTCTISTSFTYLTTQSASTTSNPMTTTRLTTATSIRSTTSSRITTSVKWSTVAALTTSIQRPVVGGTLRFQNFLALNGDDCSQSLNVSWTGGQFGVCSPFRTNSTSGDQLNATDSNLTVSFISQKPLSPMNNSGTFLLRMLALNASKLTVTCSQTFMYDVITTSSTRTTEKESDVTNMTSSTSSAYRKALSAGEIVGIAVGSFAFLVIVIVGCVALLIVCRRRHRNSQGYKGNKAPDKESVKFAPDIAPTWQSTPAISATNDINRKSKPVNSDVIYEPTDYDIVYDTVTDENRREETTELPAAAAEATRASWNTYEQPAEVRQWNTLRKGSRVLISVDLSDPAQRQRVSGVEYDLTVIDNSLYNADT